MSVRVSFLISISISILCLILNYLTFPSHMWAIYTSLLLLWLPLSIYYSKTDNHKVVSILGTLINVVFILVLNYMTTPDILWFLYVILPFFWWPITMIIGRKAGTFQFSLFSSVVIVGYYCTLNYLYSDFPWFIFIAFPVFYWPLVMYFKTKTHFAYSIASYIYISVFFIVTNYITSPQEIWAVYPVFLLTWWPLSIYFFVKKKL